jgi:zinc transporter ZupT
MTSELPYWTASLYGVLGAIAIAIGGGLVGRGRITARMPHGLLTGMGAGFLIALGLLSALPEACARSASVPIALLVAAGSFAFVMFAHRAGHANPHLHDSHAHAHASHAHVHDSHAHAPDSHAHALDARSHDAHANETQASAGLSLHDARLAVAGLALHSLLDGVAVSAALASRRELGIFVAVFVVLHKIPEGAAAAAITYTSGGAASDARWAVICVALATALGAMTIFAVGPLLALSLSVAAGVTSGVGVGIASHLEQHHAPRGRIGIALGVALFMLSEWLAHPA